MSSVGGEGGEESGECESWWTSEGWGGGEVGWGGEGSCEVELSSSCCSPASSSIYNHRL